MRFTHTSLEETIFSITKNNRAHLTYISALEIYTFPKHTKRRVINISTPQLIQINIKKAGPKESPAFFTAVTKVLTTVSNSTYSLRHHSNISRTDRCISRLHSKHITLRSNISRRPKRHITHRQVHITFAQQTYHVAQSNISRRPKRHITLPTGAY